MGKTFKKLLALLLTAVLLMGALPTMALSGVLSADKEHVFTDEENAKIENDVFASIENVKTAASRRFGGLGKMKEADYVSIIPDVVKAIENSKTYVPGTLQMNGSFLVWETTVGIPCCYDPRMEAKLHNTEDDPTPEQIARAEADAEALLDVVNNYRGGSPTSTNIGLIQPYWESSSSYSDSSFLNYSPYYKTTWQNLYGATGGQGIRYSMTNATVDNIASTMQQCGLVIFDSHGTTDYESGSDYTSRANSSYLCLTTNSGVTTTDTASHTGTYGTYYDCIKGSGYAYVNGQCISNHMSSNAPHSMLYMGICLGMATDRMFAPLRERGVEVVYGYSQSVSFKGELQSIQSIMSYIQSGMEAGAAIEQSQTDLGCQWDPAYSSYTLSQAQSNRVAFPVVASSEDTYPGQGNVDKVLTAYSTWTLFGENYTVAATSNNTSWGTVSVDGYIITASPKTGYYASGYTVVSGTATVTQNGNTFTVNPSSDCTIRINFAAKTAATINYIANGASAGTVSSYVGDSVTLPSTAPTEGDYTFIGWIGNTLTETSTKPTYYKPGASYTVTAANTTLYALYSRVEYDGTGETVYQLAEGLEDGGTYILVAEGSISGTTGYAVGNTIVSSNHYLTPVSVTINSDDTCTASSSNLAKVTWTASGSDANGYTFYNAAVGKYMGLDSSEYLYPSSTSLAWYLTDEGYLDNRVDSEGYYYLSYSSDNTVRYTTSKSGEVINLYHAVAAGTTYYTTTITVHEHEMTYFAYAAPTCTEAGHSEYWYCAGCGKYFSDANGENEITLASTVIPATGHTPGTPVIENNVEPTCTEAGGYDTVVYCTVCGAEISRTHTTVPASGHEYPETWTSNNNGTHSHYCSVCNEIETENCTYVDVVTAPTATEGGYTTHTCSKCGYTFVDSYTDPLGNDYVVTFSVPEGVPAVNYMICHENSYITLPTAGAPAGYTFLGWVTEECTDVSEQPAVLTGNYYATASVTLYALYSHVNEGGYALVDSALTNWEGEYVITYGNGTDMNVLKGISGTKKYETTGIDGSDTYSESGMTLTGSTLTGVSSIYKFSVQQSGNAVRIQNLDTKTYLASRGSYLYSYARCTPVYCNWSLSFNEGALTAMNNASKTYPYLSFSTAKNYFMVNRTDSHNIFFWKLTGSTTVYTTTVG